MGLGCLKTILEKKQEKPKSKLGLPRVTIRGQIIPQPKSPRWLRKDRLTWVLMGHQGVAINDMCEEDKIEGLQIYFFCLLYKAISQM